MFIFRIYEALWIIDTVESQLLERITNSEIVFLPKALKIPFIRNLKKPACASKREDMLVLAILRYSESKPSLKIGTANAIC